MSARLPQGYKQTEVGVIPEDWTASPLPDIVWFQEGPGLRKWQFRPSGLKVINVTNLQENGYLDLSRTERHISWDEYEKTYTHFLIDEGDVVVASSGNSYCKTAAIRQCDLPLLMNTSVIRFKAKKDLVRSYMLIYVKSKYFKDQIDLMITGGAQPNFGPVHLNRVLIPLPPTKAEQEAIAEALSNTDSLIESLEQLLAKKRHLKQGAMQELLTGKKRLPGFSGEWRTAKLGDMASLINGRAYALIEWEESGTPVIRLQNLTGRGEDFYYSNLTLPERQYCEDGDLLFMWSATFGPIIWRGPKAIFHYHIWKIECRQNHLDKQYLFHFLSDVTEKLKGSSTSGGTMLHLTKSGMEAMAIVAPDYAEQVAIASILSDMDAEIAELETQLAKTRSLKQGMMHKLLTGEIRLI